MYLNCNKVGRKWQYIQEKPMQRTALILTCRPTCEIYDKSAVVTLEMKWIKGSNPWCLWWWNHRQNILSINPLQTKRGLLYLKTQFVPRSKHFPPRL